VSSEAFEQNQSEAEKQRDAGTAAGTTDQDAQQTVPDPVRGPLVPPTAPQRNRLPQSSDPDKAALKAPGDGNQEAWLKTEAGKKFLAGEDDRQERIVKEQEAARDRREDHEDRLADKRDAAESERDDLAQEAPQEDE
jgi:hypothetical protein